MATSSAIARDLQDQPALVPENVVDVAGVRRKEEDAQNFIAALDRLGHRNDLLTMFIEQQDRRFDTVLRGVS